MTQQLSPIIHVSACESNSIHCNMDESQKLNSSLGWLSPFNGSNHQVSAWFCLVLLPFLSRARLFLLLALGFSSVNKLLSLLLSIFASIMATLDFKALLLWGSSHPSVVLPCTGAHTTVVAVLLALSTSSTQSFLWKCHKQCMSSATWHVWSGHWRQPAQLAHVLCCQYTGCKRQLLHQNPSHICLGIPLLWQLLWTTCHA